MLDAAEIDVAPNLVNTLNPAVRLPLVQDQASQLPFEGTFGIFRTWVPSRFGACWKSVVTSRARKSSSRSTATRSLTRRAPRCQKRLQ